MTSFSLQSLYVTKIFIDLILVFYTLLIFKKFRTYYAKVQYLFLCRFFVFAGFLLLYKNFTASSMILDFIGYTFLIIASYFIIAFLGTQIKQAKRQLPQAGLLILFTLIYGLMTIMSSNIQIRLFVILITLILQYGLFFYDYIHSNTREYFYVVLSQVLILLLHIGRLLNGLRDPSTVIAPLNGTIAIAIPIVLFILLDFIITLMISTQLHYKRLLKSPHSH